MTYQLIDSGHGRKLELLGEVLVERQAPTAVWQPLLDEAAWKEAQGIHIRSERGGGRWEWQGQPPRKWEVAIGGRIMQIKPTPFGHVGLFAEQVEQWAWIEKHLKRVSEELGRPLEVLNLFAYTGGSTLAAAQAACRVTHVDAARGVVEWARANAALNGLADAPIRWIVDDCQVFLSREVRRGRRYDAVILDPPTFGRGRKKEVWTIEQGLPRLMKSLLELVGRDPAMVLLSCHTPGYTPLALSQFLDDYFTTGGMIMDCGEMSVPQKTGQRRLPSGFFARRCRMEG